MKANRVSAATVCEWLDITRPTFASYIEAGVFERQPTSVGYDLRLVVRASFAHSRRTAAGRGAKGEGEILSSARARHATAAAETAELKNAVARGTFVRVSLMMEKVTATFTVIRERALGLAGKISDAIELHCPGLDRSQIDEIVDSEVREWLNELATPRTYIDAAVSEESR